MLCAEDRSWQGFASERPGEPKTGVTPMMTPRRPGNRIKSVLACLAAVCVLAGSRTAAAHPGHLHHDTDAFQARGEELPPLLSDEAINLLKVYEIDLDSDPPPRIDFTDEVLHRFLEEYREDVRIPRGVQGQRDFINGEGAEQLRMMFTLRARQYYPEARIRSDIASFRAWRTIHRQYVLGYFQGHFGAGDVPGLYLFPRHRDSTRAELTNFFILTQTTIDGRHMINRDNPEESLLLQWGLPRANARFAAPDIEGWRPYYRDTQDPRYLEHLEWIRSLVRFNQGSDYDIEYAIPGRPAADN